MSTVAWNDPSYVAIREQIDREFRCAHEGCTVLTKFVAANGAESFREQCRRCGEVVAAPRKADLSPRQKMVAVPFDEALRKSWWDRRAQRQAALYAALQSDRDRQWREAYDSYLHSAEWRALRAKILKRSGGMCEGCGERRAVQVHHLTYERLGREMLFDLVAVCLRCHESIHSRGG